MPRTTARPPALLALALALLLALTPAGTLRAQRAEAAGDGLLAGSRVRVTAPGLGSAAGRVVAAGRDSLRLDRGGRREAVTVSLAQVTRLEVSTGRQPRKLRGALIGLGFGGVVGVAAAGAFTPCEGVASCPGQPVGRGGSALWLGALGGLAGAGVGALAGTLWPGERWERRPLAF